MSKWIAEFELEDGDTMPEHMDLEYKGAKIDFHCRPAGMIKKNDVIQFTENHKWAGCFGYVTKVDKCGGGLVRCMIGVPIPMGGTAFVFDDGSGIEKVGTAVIVPADETAMSDESGRK